MSFGSSNASAAAALGCRDRPWTGVAAFTSDAGTSETVISTSDRNNDNERVRVCMSRHLLLVMDGNMMSAALAGPRLDDGIDTTFVRIRSA